MTPAETMQQDAAYLAMFCRDPEHTTLCAALLSSYLAAAQALRDDLALQHAAETSALQTIMRRGGPAAIVGGAK